jgi:solute carrier family 25 citrate transporter 1
MVGITGFGAGVTEALVVVTPFEVVKIKLQQQHGASVENMKYKGPVHCATTIVRERGPMGLWAGATPTVMRNGTNQMCLFAMKNNVDAWLFSKHEGDGTVLAPWQVSSRLHSVTLKLCSVT